jgi:Uma2 family endonuclease
VVVCDKAKLDDHGCKGSPDLVIEIISPSSAAIDYIKKLTLYEKSLVKEYWLVHPIDKVITVYQLIENNRYGRPEIYPIEAEIKVGIFNDYFVISLKGVLE